MRRFYADPERCRGSRIELDEDESHHALRVIRVRPGDEVTVLNGAGQIFDCVVEGASKRSVTLEVKAWKQVPPLSCQLTLIQAVPKGKVMDLIVQKATELGAVAIIPIITERTVVELAEEAAETRVRKWRAVALEAIKQCGSPFLPRIDAPRDFAVALGARQDTLAFVASLHEGAREVNEHLAAVRQATGSVPSAASIWVGPEGDFTPREIEALVGKGVLPITLGPLTLRCDTAAISSLAVIAQRLRTL